MRAKHKRHVSHATHVGYLPAGAGKAARFDVVGTLLAGFDLVALLYGCLQEPRIICLPLACLLLLGFLWYERRIESDRAIFPTSLRNNRRFMLAAALRLAVTFGVFALTFLVANYVQSVAGQPAFWAGAALAPASVASVLTAPIAGRWLDDGKARLTLHIGFKASALGTALCALVAVTNAPWWLLSEPPLFSALAMGTYLHL